MGEPQLLLTLGPMLPLPVLSDLLGGIRQAMLRAGVTEPALSSGLEVYAQLPEPDTRVEYHEIGLAPSDVHDDMVGWVCSCGETAASSYGDVGGATFFATGHIPPGAAWAVVPARELWAAEKVEDHPVAAGLPELLGQLPGDLPQSGR